MDTMARGRLRLLLLLSLAMATTAGGRLSHLLLLLLSQMLLPSLAMDTMADMATTAIMGRGLLMLMLTTAMEDTEDMVMDMVMAMDMVTAMATVMDTVMAMVMVMAMDTTDKKEGW